jgi:hypothetical protein
MAMMAVQAYLIASLNLLLASRRGNEQLSSSQIVAILCQMVEGEQHFPELSYTGLLWLGKGGKADISQE